MANLYTLERAKWTTEKRKQYLKEHPENHAGPNGSFPIEDTSDVNDAWRLAGHADNPDTVRSKIKSIARRLGLESGLPDTAKEDDDEKERSMGAEHTDEALGGASNDSQGTNLVQEHNDSEDRAVQSTSPISLYMPIVRSTTAENGDWIVEGQVTSDALDYYDTVFDFESAKKAFARWRGNIREQHDSKKAVGKAIEWYPDEENRCITLRSRVSKGAPDTWQKVLDDVLTGYSVSLDPRTVKTEMIQRNGKRVKRYSDYDYLEVSLVDAPGSPGCDITIVRADGMITDVLDTSEEETPPVTISSVAASSVNRAGARVSSDTRSAMHQGIGHTIKAAVSQMKNCGCDDCAAAMKMIDPDEDGDVDMGGYDDPDSDWQSLYGGGNEDTERMLSGLIERVLDAKLHAVSARLQGIAGTIARSNAAPTEASMNTLITGAIERAVQSATAANESSLAEVRASQEAVKEQVGSIAKQVADIANTPVPGAPVMNAGALPRPVEKRLPTDPYQSPQRSGSSVYDAIAQLSAQGQLDTIDKQVDAMHAGLVAQRRG